MDRSDDPRAALVRLRGVHLLPAVLCRRCCGAGGCLIPEDAKHRRPTAGHQSRHSALFTLHSSRALPAAAHTASRSPARMASSWVSQSGCTVLPTLS